jgi:hypothetical protein
MNYFCAIESANEHPNIFQLFLFKKNCCPSGLRPRRLLAFFIQPQLNTKVAMLFLLIKPISFFDRITGFVFYFRFGISLRGPKVSEFQPYHAYLVILSQNSMNDGYVNCLSTHYYRQITPTVWNFFSEAELNLRRLFTKNQAILPICISPICTIRL